MLHYTVPGRRSIRASQAMRPDSRVARFRAAAVALSLLLAACSQGKNEPCQLQSDCEDGLLCIIADGVARGRCESPSQADGGTPSDAAVDSGEPPLPSDDAGSEDGGGPGDAG